MHHACIRTIGHQEGFIFFPAALALELVLLQQLAAASEAVMAVVRMYAEDVA